MEDLRSYINQLRKDFATSVLLEENTGDDPYSLFEKWLKEAVSAQAHEPNAMVLSTVSQDGKPSSRIVLLRDFTEEGLVFFTNYNSRKGQDIQSNKHASLLFFWPEIERQIRIDGVIERTSEEVSDAYFLSRPRESRLGAWASAQSKEIPSREFLEDLYNEADQRFKGKDIPRPAHWGGFILKPDYIEFWQGRPSRLHDRLFFKKENNDWTRGRLSP